MNPIDLTSNSVAFFGYGSLVNEFTWSRDYDSQPLEIRNWIREWRHCVDAPFGRTCALTVTRRPNSRLQGILIRCNADELAQIDEREIGYERVELSHHDVVSVVENLPKRLYIYTSMPDYNRWGSWEYPIWFSYAEVVLYGYLKVFEKEGVDKFIHSTSGWMAPILDDRKAPRYPRISKLPMEDRTFIERKIQNIDGVTIYSI